MGHVTGDDLDQEESRGEEQHEVQLDRLQSSEPLFHSHDPAKTRGECLSTLSTICRLRRWRITLRRSTILPVLFTTACTFRKCTRFYRNPFLSFRVSPEIRDFVLFSKELARHGVLVKTSLRFEVHKLLTCNGSRLSTFLKISGLPRVCLLESATVPRMVRTISPSFLRRKRVYLLV